MLAIEQYSKEANEEEKRMREEMVNCLLSSPKIRLNIPQKVLLTVDTEESTLTPEQ